jgi:hypothetical protein
MRQKIFGFVRPQAAEWDAKGGNRPLTLLPLPLYAASPRRPLQIDA